MSADLREAAALLTLEAMLLDEQDWDAWLALYVEDADYDSRAGLEERVQRIRSGKSVASTPLRRTAHMVGTVLLAGESDGILSVKSSFNVHVYDTRQKTQHVFFGRTTHGLVRRDGALRIRRKKVILANDCIPTMLDVYCV